MINREAVLNDIEENKIIVIMRGFTTEQLICAVDAMEKGGIRLVEVTFDQSGIVSDDTTAKNIRTLKEKFEGRVRVGAGTVMTEKQVELTAYAGGKFIISPDTNPDIIRKTVDMGLVSIPGSITPSEATLAVRSGADFVKMFPVGEMGSSYLKAVAVPLSHIRFLAVGGVTENNAQEYIKAGACGIGVSSSIANVKLIKEGKFDEIAKLAENYLKAVKGE
jgi:2-dehydro-3-deoxyphosphogluconate aldolase/(4S)-4-hydroxy-2-oxoglutarate aldolase